MTIRALNIATVLRTPPPALDFVLPGLPAGSVGTIVGAGGVGKTTFLLQTALGLSAENTGIPELFPTACAPCRVVYLAAEETADLLRIRLHSIAKSARKERICQSDDLCISSWEDNLLIVPGAGICVSLIADGARTTYFQQLCDFCKDARLVILDPLRRMHDGDENDSSAMTRIAETLEALATRTRAAVVAVHHVGKSAVFNGAGDSAASSRGSTALTDAVRWQLNISTMSDSEATKCGLDDERRSYLRLDYAKTNYIAPQPTQWLRRMPSGVLERVHLPAFTSAKVPSQSRRKIFRDEASYV